VVGPWVDVLEHRFGTIHRVGLWDGGVFSVPIQKIYKEFVDNRVYPIEFPGLPSSFTDSLFVFVLESPVYHARRSWNGCWYDQQLCGRVAKR
jgi:hypothetical protein